MTAPLEPADARCAACGHPHPDASCREPLSRLPQGDGTWGPVRECRCLAYVAPCAPLASEMSELLAEVERLRAQVAELEQGESGVQYAVRVQGEVLSRVTGWDRDSNGLARAETLARTARYRDSLPDAETASRDVWYGPWKPVQPDVVDDQPIPYVLADAPASAPASDRLAGGAS